MKTPLIIVGVLTVAVYGIDLERLQQFNLHVQQCANGRFKLVQNETSQSRQSIYNFHVATAAQGPWLFQCILYKDGQVLNENGEFVKEKFSKFLEDIISRQPEREEAQKLFNYCYDNAVQHGYVGFKRTYQLLRCSWRVLQFF